MFVSIINALNNFVHIKFVIKHLFNICVTYYLMNHDIIMTLYSGVMASFSLNYYFEQYFFEFMTSSVDKKEL